jgi:hypothetical protein
MIRRAVVLAAAAVLAALAVSAPITLARFTSTETTAATFSTATLRPPTGVVGTGGASASLTWTASSSSSATGYRLLRSSTSGSGYAQVKNVTPVSATSTSDTPADGVWYYVLETYLGNWTSAHSNEATVTIGTTTSTDVAPCASETAETVNAGNDDGYETNPANGCIADAHVAVDANSGTSTALDCADAGKDRERFWGYSLGLPGTVRSISGITVQLVMGLNNNSGTNQACVQLSWDGGASWTAPQTATLNKVPLATYTLGSTTDDWGHAGWTPTQLNATNFVVRLTDMSDTTSKTFKLDSVGVSVAYRP